MKMRFVKGIILVLFTGLVFASCSKESNPEEDILGTWTVENVDFEATIGTKSLLQYYMDEFSMTEPQAQAVMAAFDAALAQQFTGTIEIRADNTYTATMGDESDTGTWSLSSDYKKLTLDSDSDETIVLDIISLTSAKAVMGMAEEISEDLNDDDVPEDISVTIEMILEKQ
ncbi:MAG: hypothetical protein JXR67_06690 [Bacteroidales bacterium]|nr:hypothetical protein [Bacteroidales bacterium]